MILYYSVMWCPWCRIIATLYLYLLLLLLLLFLPVVHARQRTRHSFLCHVILTAENTILFGISCKNTRRIQSRDVSGVFIVFSIGSRGEGGNRPKEWVYPSAVRMGHTVKEWVYPSADRMGHAVNRQPIKLRAREGRYACRVSGTAFVSEGVAKVWHPDI